MGLGSVGSPFGWTRLLAQVFVNPCASVFIRASNAVSRITGSSSRGVVGCPCSRVTRMRGKRCGSLIPLFPKLFWPLDRRLPIQMPIIFPKVFEWHQFGMAVGQSHVDRAGHFVVGRKVTRSTGGTAAAVSRNCATSHLVQRYAEWLTSVKVVVRRVRFFGPHIHPVLVEKHRSQRRLL